MGRNVTRREALKIAGGSALGLLLTPVPWKVVADSALWTQNWAMTPRLPRGSITFQETVCTLCPTGCAVRARCVGGTPVSLSGVARDTASGGVLCAAGLGAHQLPWHPARLRAPLRRSGVGRGERWNALDAEAAASCVRRRSTCCAGTWSSRTCRRRRGLAATR